MADKTRSQVPISVFFMAGGILSALGGGLALSRFLDAHSLDDDLSMAQFTFGLIVPHIFVVLGVGVLFYGAILAAKTWIIARRRRQ